MCFGVKSDGQIDQSQFDFKWAGIKQNIVGLHEVLTLESLCRVVRAVEGQS